MRFPRRSRRDIDVRELVDRHLDSGDPTGWFEEVYARAIPRLTAVPWAAGAAHPLLTDWLVDRAPAAVTGGGHRRRVAVVGCGVGDDAAAVAGHGYEVTAFDVSPTAVRWARRRFPRHGIRWRVADILTPDDDLVHAFDVVVEVGNVAWLPGVVRDAAMTGISRLVADGGAAVVIALTATSAEAADAVAGPPWPQAPSELATYRVDGLVRTALEHAPAGPGDATMEVRATWHRPAGATARPV